MSQKIVIVIPTYNEKENIQELLKQVFAFGISDLHVLVVDDNSPDGTGHVVEELRKRYKNLHVLHRKEKQGLGPAYVAGFQWALRQGAEYILQMDADLSHDPKRIHAFLKAAQEYDMILGSRYIRGGRIENWNFFRRFISRFGNFYARIILKIPIRDLTGGFKCYRRKVLERLDLQNISSLGYNFQIEITFMAYQKGVSIKELPIVFTERRHGRSKFDARIIGEAFWKILLLRFKKHADQT